jgi:hypothetical protein
MAEPFPLYHWSPHQKYNQILRRGLVPGCWSKDRLWKPPFICFSDSPSLAWALSGKISKIYGIWDLWMTWSNEPSGYEELNLQKKGTNDNPSGKPTEYRVYERIFKSQLWYVGSRNALRK